MASSKETETLQDEAGQLRLVNCFKAQYVSLPLFSSTHDIPMNKPPTNTSTSSQDNQTAGWSNLWDTDSSNLWDRGMPSPALIDFIEERVNPLTEDGRRKKALVPVRPSLLPCSSSFILSVSF